MRAKITAKPCMESSCERRMEQEGREREVCGYLPFGERVAPCRSLASGRLGTGDAWGRTLFVNFSWFFQRNVLKYHWTLGDVHYLSRRMLWRHITRLTMGTYIFCGLWHRDAGLSFASRLRKKKTRHLPCFLKSRRTACMESATCCGMESRFSEYGINANCIVWNQEWRERRIQPIGWCHTPNGQFHTIRCANWCHTKPFGLG